MVGQLVFARHAAWYWHAWDDADRANGHAADDARHDAWNDARDDDAGYDANDAGYDDAGHDAWCARASGCVLSQCLFQDWQKNNA